MAYREYLAVSSIRSLCMPVSLNSSGFLITRVISFWMVRAMSTLLDRINAVAGPGGPGDVPRETTVIVTSLTGSSVLEGTFVFALFLPCPSSSLSSLSLSYCSSLSLT